VLKSSNVTGKPNLLHITDGSEIVDMPVRAGWNLKVMPEAGLQATRSKGAAHVHVKTRLQVQSLNLPIRTEPVWRHASISA